MKAIKLPKLPKTTVPKLPKMSMAMPKDTAAMPGKKRKKKMGGMSDMTMLSAKMPR
jgi:hypothetical protein